MRIVWKDSNARGYKPINYRGYVAKGYSGGWIIDVPGDNNIYKSHYCALNAIDKHLGGTGNKGAAGEKRRSCGIEIIGKKNNESA